MKRCNQCFQIYTDDYGFCLTDGTSLVFVPDTHSQPTILAPPPSFQFPTQTQPSTDVNRDGTNTIAFIVLGLIMLVAFGLLGFYLLRSDSQDTNSNKNENTGSNLNVNSEKTDLEREKLEREKTNLQIQKDNLELEKQKLKQEKNKLDQQKTVTQPGSSASTALVPRPTANVRESPNGSILCKITYQATIRIYGSTNVADNNGVWYYTDFCGRMGVIHSSQFRYN